MNREMSPIGPYRRSSPDALTSVVGCERTPRKYYGTDADDPQETLSLAERMLELTHAHHVPQ
jgi:hypothetical protein